MTKLLLKKKCMPLQDMQLWSFHGFPYPLAQASGDPNMIFAINLTLLPYLHRRYIYIYIQNLPWFDRPPNMKNKKHHFKNNISGQISLPKFSTTPPKKWIFLRPKGLRFHWRRCCWLRSTGSNDSLWYRSASTLAPPLSPRMPRIFFSHPMFFWVREKKRHKNL